jgi:hypothetical protein
MWTLLSPLEGHKFSVLPVMEAQPAFEALCVYSKNKTMEKGEICFNLINTNVT